MVALAGTGRRTRCRMGALKELVEERSRPARETLRLAPGTAGAVDRGKGVSCRWNETKQQFYKLWTKPIRRWLKLLQIDFVSILDGFAFLHLLP